MPELNQDFTLYKDSDFSVCFNFTNYDPTSVDAIWVMKDTSGATILTKTIGNGLTSFSTKIVLEINPIDTVNLEPIRYKHELRITTPELTTAPVSIGAVVLKEALTASIY